ncbi:MAG: bifunctional precorrin-2 dehydrogenase/sirohydrochlorin ferrochelatase [Nitrospiraceae bacterium]|nr:MAG: bifunctional precorrin-2 dehydrogenase/sirohydrochlorin ferrochelatase [Nitrospiraceae bacterium]
MNYYPAFLNLSSKKIVVIGGGTVAERKILQLMRADADTITVISPEITQRLLKERNKNRFIHIRRNYRKKDLDNAFLVIAATDEPSLNTKIARDAPCLVNVVDEPAECNFIVPSVIKKGPLHIAISTSGVSPAFARTLRKDLERLHGADISEYLSFLKTIRAKALIRITDRRKRERFLKRIASETILKTLRKEGIDAVKKSILIDFKKQTT